MPPNFGLGMVLKGRTLGLWGYGKIGQIVAGYGKAFGMHVTVWGSESARAKAKHDGHIAAPSCEAFFEACDVLSLHLRLHDSTRAVVKLDALSRMKPTALLVNTSRAELIEEGALVGAGSLVGEGKVIPPRSLVLGSPGKVVRELRDEDVARILRGTNGYVKNSQRFKSGFKPQT